MTSIWRTVVAAFLIGGVTGGARAQEAPNVTAPTQPPPGGVIVRGGLFAYVFDGGDPAVARDGFVVEERFRLAIGLTKELSIDAMLPIFQGSFDDPALGQTSFDTSPIGIGDVDLNLKLRIFKEDLGPVDTIRVSLFGGTSLPTEVGGFGSRSFDPQLGVSAMGIFGRHGITQSLAWRFTTAGSDEPLFAGDTTADVFATGTAYLYRVAPDEFTEEHKGAWYFTAELLGTAETNGDLEFVLAPGILYEGPRWAFELTVGVPVVQNVNDRATTSFVASLGFRVLF
ncbi:MAG: hypothetical protein SGJ09_13760 [Phycisphaerae bacterium]|nr:hypothetical protein [Phycisphaerae bacterium]